MKEINQQWLTYRERYSYTTKFNLHRVVKTPGELPIIGFVKLRAEDTDNESWCWLGSFGSDSIRHSLPAVRATGRIKRRRGIAGFRAKSTLKGNCRFYGKLKGRESLFSATKKRIAPCYSIVCGSLL